MVRKIRKTVRTVVRGPHSRWARRRRGGKSSSMASKYSGGKRVGRWPYKLFPRAFARWLGATWADPRKR